MDDPPKKGLHPVMVFVAFLCVTAAVLGLARLLFWLSKVQIDYLTR